jgi:hypothetical protein
VPRLDRASLLIKAPLDWAYQALVDPDLIVQWLPPGGAKGTITHLEARPGGPFAITLTFDDAAGAKSTHNSDRSKGGSSIFSPRGESANPSNSNLRTRHSQAQ